MKPATVVGWTGYGSLSDLQRDAAVRLNIKSAQVLAGGGFLVIREADPVGTARALVHLPGVNWIAIGYEFADFQACMESISVLAKKYLKRGESFAVSAHVSGSERTDGDVILEANSRILYAVKGLSISEKNPDVKFRVIMMGDGGACAVQLKEGPGGVPTSRGARAYCLVSGGYHSSVMAWLAALAGFSVTLVHERASDEALRQVSRLYSELSYRVNPARLELLVLEGRGKSGDALRAWLNQGDGMILVGSHPECRGPKVLKSFDGWKVLSPLLLLQEGEIRARLKELGLKEKAGDAGPTLKSGSTASPYTKKRYGGKTADHNAVLDSILS